MKKFLKQFYWVILGIFLLGVVFSAPALKQWNNSKFELSQYRMLFTDTGLPNGTPVIDINSWWSNISYWPLLDWELNPYITWYSETDPVFLTNSGNYYPLAWNSISNPITGALYMENGSGAFNLEVLTWQNVGLPMTADVPVLTPTAFLPGAGIFKVMLTKGRQFFMGEPGENTQMYLANSTGDIGWKLDSNDDSARFKLQPFTGWAMNGLMWYTQWNVDWTIQAGNTGIITAINAWPAETYVTKGYVDTVTDEYIPRTSVDTGWNNTGSDVIIPSEKLVWSLVSWLNNNYVPIWDGSKFINSSIFKTTDFLSLAHISTWAFLRIHDDFIFASTNIVDWKITENRFMIWTPDWWTTGVYIEWKMLDWVIDVYADTGVNLNTTDVVITGNIYADWSSVKFNTESFVWWFNSSVGGIKSASIWHNCQANGDFSIAIWSYSRAIWDSSISMWNQVKTYAHSSTALWRHTEARSAYWVVMGNYNVGNTDSLLEIWDGTPTTWYNEFEFKRDGRFIISEEWSFILNASGNLDVQYLSGSSWETADTFTKS